MNSRGELETHLRSGGYNSIAGVDEVGRGCLAGPVYAGSVVLDYDKLTQLDEKTRNYLRDSKKLTPKRRGEMIKVIEDIAITYATASSSVEEIEKEGIVGATFLAMKRAISSLEGPIDYLLVDGNKPVPNYSGKQASVINGDNLCYCIAASSILAKEQRDQFMKDKAGQFPHYGFEQHVGYGTKKHLEAIAKLGVSIIHRRNFAPIKKRLNATNGL